jgi:hypothetical protein
MDPISNEEFMKLVASSTYLYLSSDPIKYYYLWPNGVKKFRILGFSVEFLVN